MKRKPVEPKRVMVTGSQGFVGRHLAGSITGLRATMVGVDLPGTGADVEVDLGDPGLDVDALLESVGPVDAIIWMAAKITRGSSVDAAARRNLRAIAEAPVRVLEAFATRGRGLPHLVACSTFKMYGPADDQDSDNPELIDPEAPPQSPDPHSYGSAKFLAERLLANASRRLGIRHAVVRPSCIYGPGQHGHNAIPRFLTAALAGESPVVFGDGTSLRDDVFAPDLARLMGQAALQRAHGAFHASGDQARSVLDVAQLCCMAVHAEGGVKVEPVLDASKAPKWWIDQRFDRSASDRDLSYRPVPLIEGLRRQVRWMKAGADPKATVSFGKMHSEASR